MSASLASPRHASPIIVIEPPTLLGRDTVQDLQHPTDALLRRQECPLTAHPRLHPTGIHDDGNGLLLLEGIRLVHGQHVQRGFADRVRRALDKALAARPEPGRHVEHDAPWAEILVEGFEELGWADDVGVEVRVEIGRGDGECCLV